LFAFWGLLLFASWGAIPDSAPVTAWMPVLSTVATVFIVVPVITVALNIFGTLRGQRENVKANLPLQFVFLGVIGFLVAGLMNIVSVLPGVSPATNFTWFNAAKAYAQCFGFFALVMFGAIYHIVPQLARIEFPSRLLRAHLWLAGVGVLFLVLALAIGGLVQGFQLQDANVPFTNVSKGTLMFLRASTIGDLLIALGNVMFLVNVAGVVTRFCRTRAVAAYDVATADLFKPAEAKP
jgi:cytochrome c oxidase cbb3-type subunit 1